MDTKINPKYFFFALLALSVFFVAYLFKPFLTVLILSASLSLVLHPVYKWIQSKISWQSGWLSSFITLILFIIVLCTPMFFLGKVILKESTDMYKSLTSTYESSTVLNELEIKIEKLLPDSVDIDLNQRVADVLSIVSKDLGNIFSSTLNTLFSFFLVLISMFYFLKDGHIWKKSLIKLSPLPDKNDNKIIDRLKKSVNGIMLGYLFIGFAQGFLLGLGLYIFGIPNAALLGVIAAVASLVPMVGTGLVALPIILFLFFIGDTFSAVGFSIWAGLLVGTSDEILRPIVIGKQLDISPLLVLFSVLGGIAVLGPVGVLIGPLSVSLLHSLLSIYKDK